MRLTNARIIIIIIIICSVQVYFVGPNAKKQPGMLDGANNNGYDDDQGSYLHVPHDHVGYRYEVFPLIQYLLNSLFK